MNLRAAAPNELPTSTTVQLGPNFLWTVPDDPGVDLAVAPLAMDQTTVDYEPIPSTFFATDEIVKQQMIGEGDAVTFTGLFVQMPGLTRLEPIVRQGFIAMMPNEKIRTTLGKLGNIYLADVHVFGGNSGSPMFVNLSGMRNGKMIVGANYKLLGVVSGYEIEDTSFNLQAATTYDGTLGANSGVATVVPAAELEKLLSSPILERQRNDAISRTGKK